MHRTITTVVLILGSIALTGCESKQHMAARLQTEYAEAYKQYYTDCVAPMDNGAAAALSYDPNAPKNAAKPKTDPSEEKKHSDKCTAESAKADKLQQQLAAAASK